MREITTAKTILNEQSQTLKDFFKDIDKYPIYSGDEQVQLAREALAGNEKSREKLITSNLRFVVTCAKKYTGQGVSLLDLIQAGMVGLCLAIDNYNPDLGYKFLSFAVWYIRKEILKEIYDTGRTIRYPISYISKITKVKRAYDNFVTTNQREPTDEELIDLASVTQKQYDSVVLNKSYCLPFDTPVIDDEQLTLGDTIADTSVSDSFIKDGIYSTFSCLTPRERKVIIDLFGLEGNGEKTTKEVAKELNLGEERVRQLRKTAVKKLREKFGTTLKTLL